MENVFGLLASRFRVLLGTMEQRLKIVTDSVLTCDVLYNMMGTRQVGGDRAPTLADAIVALQNEQVVYVPDDKSTKRLLQLCWRIDWARGQDL